MLTASPMSTNRIVREPQSPRCHQTQFELILHKPSRSRQNFRRLLTKRSSPRTGPRKPCLSQVYLNEEVPPRGETCTEPSGLYCLFSLPLP